MFTIQKVIDTLTIVRKCGWCGVYEVFSPLEEKPLMTELLEYGSTWNLVPDDVKLLCVSRYDCQRRRALVTFRTKEENDNWYMYLNPKYFLPENQRQWF